MKIKRMNSALGKKIISLLRNGDYAHPGAEEAIDMVFKNIPKQANRSLLDVGCGLGGTADYLQKKGYGKVTGVEIDKGILALAKNKYPELNLILADINEVDKILNIKFDLIYHFCSFYAFPDQLKVLKTLRKVAHDKTELIIFDYAVSGSCRKNTKVIPHPLDLKKIDNMFEISRWEKLECNDISGYYKKEYADFVSKIKEKRNEIIRLSDKESYEYVKSSYEKIYGEYCTNGLLAVILKARAI